MAKAESEGEKLDRELHDRRSIIDLLGAELTHQRQGYASRASSMNSRLGILVAAASLVTGLQSSTTSPGLFVVIGACLSALAALTGVFGFWPRSGDENGIESLQAELWNLSPDHAAYLLLHRQLEVLKDDEQFLRRKAWVVRVGFALLALSIVAAATHAIQLSTIGDSIVQQPIPSHTPAGTP